MAIAYSSLRSGRPEAAIVECDKAYSIDAGRMALDYKRQTLHLRGVAYLAMKRIDEAERTAGKLKALIETGLNRKAMRRYDNLMGAVELARGNMPKALEYLERAVLSLPYGPFEKDAWFIGTLAEAYLSAGDRIKAREQYERITTLTTGRVSYGDTYARSFYHLGRIDEELGDKTAARTNYQKFLALWKNADPGLPEVPDARSRLNALR
jgi:tetratricopeptide (TPR) repeat protein